MPALSTSAPDYRAILLRLVDKIRRTGINYRQMARRTESAGLSGNDPAGLARADSLSRCADDMQYVFERAVERLSSEDLEQLTQSRRRKLVETQTAQAA